MQIRYTGPFDSVVIPSLGIVVVSGEAFDAPAATAARLLEQDCFEAATAKKATAKKATAKPTTTTTADAVG